MKKAVVLAFLGLSACGTIIDIVSYPQDIAFDSPGPHIYGGVRLDVVLGFEPFSRGSWGIIHWVDLPLSLAFDTAILPVTVFLSFFKEGRDYITVDGPRLDRIIAQEALSWNRSLWYFGSEDGYHHLRFSGNHANTHYRIRESELFIERPFARTTDSEKYVAIKVIKVSDDP